MPSNRRRPTPSRRGLSRLPARSRDWLALGLGLSCIAALSATAGALSALLLAGTPLHKGDASEQQLAAERPIAKPALFPQLSRPVNVLVVGTKVLTSDIGRSPGAAGYHQLVNAFTGLADTILLLRFDPETGAATVLSIPRDTRVRLPGRGEVKINTTNQRGGPTLTARAVQALLGEDVPVDRYIRLNVQGVERLIDALGGVDLYVPKDMQYQDDSQHLYINLQKGQQRLDGNRALQFLRFRHDDLGDIGRVQRQQLLMRAAVEQTLRPQTIARLPQIFEAIESNVDTNLSIEEMLALSGFAAGVRADGTLRMLMLPGRFGRADNNAAGYWVPDTTGIARVRQQHFGISEDPTTTSTAAVPSDTAAAAIRIAIQDSSDRPEVARALAQQLRAWGYRVTLGRAWPEPLASTRILAQGGDSQAAQALQAQLGRGEIRVESTGVLGSDVTVVLGRDWPQTQLQ